MINYEIIKGVSKQTNNPYTLVRMTFLLKDGDTYVIDKFLTKDEARALSFIASDEQIHQYQQTQEAF